MRYSGKVKSTEKIKKCLRNVSLGWLSGKIKKKKNPIILLLKGAERVTKALPGVSRHKIALLLSKAIIRSLWVWHRGTDVRAGGKRSVPAATLHLTFVMFLNFSLQEA